MEQKTSTLARSERMLAAPVLALFVVLGVVGGVLVARNPQPVALVLWLACVGSNAFFLVRHGRPSIGMAPIALFSLAPACGAALTTFEAGSAGFAICAGALAISLLLLVAFSFWFVRLARVCHSGRVPDEDALIVVLGGKVVNGAPAKTLARRLDVGAGLCLGHPGRRLILSGGTVQGEKGTEAEAMARYLQSSGVDARQLVLESEARNTHENIAFALELVRREGLQGQLCVLSSDYHLWRAVREGRRAGVELLPVSAPTPMASRAQQWCREVLTIWFARA